MATGFGTVTVKLDELYDGAKQDLLDGAALSRLREALRADEGGYFLVDVPSHHGPFTIEVHGGTTWQVSGATIAEAADACREALEK